MICLVKRIVFRNEKDSVMIRRATLCYYTWTPHRVCCININSKIMINF